LNLENNAINETRAKVSFETNTSSYLLHLFFNFFVTQLLEKNCQTKNMEEIKSIYDARLCRLDDKVEETFQKFVKEIKDVSTFEKYFLYMGYPSFKIEKLN